MDPPHHHHHHRHEVDLHILVVPESQWRPDLRLAYSTTCMTSVSAGFVRVDPNVSLVELRGEISRQLDSPSLPESYIFLRCVGRYLCTVSRHQELSLSSKLFVPPLAACPEIYLLNASLTEGAHDTLSTLPPTHLPPANQPPNHTSQTASVPHHTGHCLTPSVHPSHTAPASQHTITQLSPAPTSQHTSSHPSPLNTPHPSPSSHPSRRAHYSPHSTSDYVTGEGSGGGGNWLNSSPDILLEEEGGTLGSSHSQGYYRGLPPQSRPDNHPHHHELQATRVRQSKKSKSVHFGSPTTFGGDTPSPTPDTTAPDTTTVDLESLALSPSSPLSEAQSLLAQIRTVKDESKHLGALKEGLSSNIRQLQHTLQARKEKDNGEWKQKLESERKRKKKLERTIRKLRTEIEAVDQVSTAKKKSSKKSSVGVEQQQQKDSKSSVAKSESDHTNLKLECKRADVDMQQLRKTRDEEKQKLKVEQEKHQCIVDECKVLKKELNQLKIAQNRLKKK